MHLACSQHRNNSQSSAWKFKDKQFTIASFSAHLTGKDDDDDDDNQSTSVSIDRGGTKTCSLEFRLVYRSEI